MNDDPTTLRRRNPAFFIWICSLVFFLCFLCGVFYRIARDSPRFSPRRFEKVKVSWTKDRVYAYLGKPDNQAFDPKNGGYFKYYRFGWTSGSLDYIVEFDNRGLVTGKKTYPAS